MTSVTKPGKRRHGAAEADGENAFQNDSQNDAAPADENGRRIQIRHRRPAFQPHAKHQAERMDDAAEHHQPERRAPQRLGQFGRQRERQQGDDRQQKRRHINDHGLVERLEFIEEKFLHALPGFRHKPFAEPVAVIVERLIEGGGLVLVVGRGHRGIILHRRD